jgi:hypothetical protein
MTRVVPALLYTVLLLASFSGVFSAESRVERLRLLLSAGLWSMFLVLTLIRGRSRNSNRSPLAVMAAVLVHFVTVGVVPEERRRVLVCRGNVLLLTGLVFSLVSVTALGVASVSWPMPAVSLPGVRIGCAIPSYLGGSWPCLGSPGPTNFG